MPFHSSEDFATIFDSTMGSGYDAVVSPPVGDDYSATVIPFRDVQKVDDFGNLSEKTTVLQILRSSLPGQLARDTTITVDGRTYTVESLLDQTTYIDTYEVS